MRPTTIASLMLAGAAIPAQAGEALVGATVIDGTGRTIADGAVITDGDRIACVGKRGECPVPAGATVRDLTGQFVTPGLIDAHVHFAQTGWLDGRPDGVEDRTLYPYEKTIADLRADPGRWHRAYLCSGVTAVFDVGGAPWTIAPPDAAPSTDPERVHVRSAGPLMTAAGAAHLFSYGTLANQPVFLPMESETQIRADVARLKAMGAAAVKVLFLPPSPQEAERTTGLMAVAGDAARISGLPLIVHATELAHAKAALRAGAAMLVHSVEDSLVDDEFLALMKANDATYAPTMVVGRNWIRALVSVATREAAEVDDPNRCVDEAVLARIADAAALSPAFVKANGTAITPFAQLFEKTGRAAQIMTQNLAAVHGAGIRIVLATDAGNPLTVHGPSALWEMEAMQAAGMEPAAIIHAATLAAAQAMGLEEDIGTIERGKIADLLILPADPTLSVAAFRKIIHVMRAGVLKAQKELQVR